MCAVEHWRAVKGFEGYYEVSDLGNVRSVDREVLCKNGTSKFLKGHIMTQSTHYKNGYKSVILTVGCKQKRLLIHRIVAQAFLPNPENLPEINHIDENKANNCLSNLEWCNHEYNNRYGTKRERLSKRRNKKVRQLKDGTLIALYESATIAAKAINGTQGGVSSCCRGDFPTYKGFTWEYV